MRKLVESQKQLRLCNFPSKKDDERFVWKASASPFCGSALSVIIWLWSLWWLWQSPPYLCHCIQPADLTDIKRRSYQWTFSSEYSPVSTVSPQGGRPYIHCIVTPFSFISVVLQLKQIRVRQRIWKSPQRRSFLSLGKPFIVFDKCFGLFNVIWTFLIF